MTRGSGMLIGVVLVACAASPAPTANATAPARPAVPATWVSIENDAGDTELVVPPDLAAGVLDSSTFILVQAPFDGRLTPLEVWATGRSALADQPAGGETIRAWLERGSWFPVEGNVSGIATLGAVSERHILLPAGRAVELATTVEPGTPEQSRVLAYAIETANGVAVLRVLGEPEVIEARAEELWMMALLVRFGD